MENNFCEIRDVVYHIYDIARPWECNIITCITRPKPRYSHR